MPTRAYAVLKGGPADDRLVLVERGQQEFLFPISACNCGVIHYDEERKLVVETLTYYRTERRLKGMPVFEFQPAKKEREDEAD